MGFLRFLVIFAVFLALVWLSLQNSEKATLKFFNVAQWEAPLVVVVLVAFACGAAAGLLAGAVRATRLKRQLNKLRREQRGNAPALTPSPSPVGGRGEME
ncbi:MAG: DUF1049 domain-containing protein [Burkholderiales bacterium]|nr:DUF1049 domain-containing protein [Burkholderiales bacterium]